MSTALLLFQQVIMMFILAGVGYVLFRRNIISLEGSKTLGNILIHISLPCVIISSFLKEFSLQRLIGLGISALMAALVLVISMIVSRLAFRKDGLAAFAAAFANPGFFGVPIIAALLGNEKVFYIAPFIAFLNLLQWTWGVSLLTGNKGSLSAKSVLTAPFMIAILVGFFFFVTQIPMPGIISQAINYIAGLNTPLAMFAIGVYLAQADVKHMFLRRSLYGISLVRLVVIPLIALALLSLVPNTFSDLKIAVLIASACPTGSNVAVYAHLYNGDYPYAVETVIVSTIFSVVTMPLIMQLATVLW